MKDALEMAAPSTQEPQRDHDRPLRLAECGDTLGIKEVCAVLGISRRELLRLREHGIFPRSTVYSATRWTNAAIQHFLTKTGRG